MSTDPLYRELDAGEWAGLTREQIAARGEDVLERFLSGSPDVSLPAGESRRELWARARRALASLCERGPGERIAIVTHGGFVNACFPKADPTHASIHRSPADEVIERLDRGLGSGHGDVY